MDHKKKIKANLKPGKGNKIQFYKNGKPLGVAFEEVNDGVYYPAVSLFKSAKVMTNGRNWPWVFTINGKLSTDCHGLTKKLFPSQRVTFGYLTEFSRFEQTLGQNGRNLLKMVKNSNQ